MSAAAGETLREAVTRLARAFAAAGIADAQQDARLIVAAAAGVDRTALLVDADRRLSVDAGATLDVMARRRLAREPVTRILGRRGFWTLDLAIGPEVLDPRPDTETVVEAVLARIDPGQSLRLLDLGTGSGAILLALLDAVPAAFGIGADRSPAAALRAQMNAQATGLAGRSAFLCGDWAEALAGRFDVVVSNPPYLRSDELATIDPEVALHDPLQALDGGADGLEAYRAIAEALPALLQPGGLAAFEVGAGQADDVTDIMRRRGLTPDGVECDLAGIPRCVVMRA